MLSFSETNMGVEMPWMTWRRMLELTLPCGAYLRALRIARAADVKLIAVYWCGGNLPEGAE